MAKRITPKMEAFCQEMAKPRAKQKDAYRAAYDCRSMSDRAVSNEASKLMARPEIAMRIKEIRNDAARECRWEICDAAAPLLEVIDGALPVYTEKAAEGVIDNFARMAITESVKLLNEMFGLDAGGGPVEGGVTIVDDIG